MPYAAIEDIYETLSSEKQREVYDFIRFLAAQAGRKVSPSTPIESYSDDFFGSLWVNQRFDVHGTNRHSVQ